MAKEQKQQFLDDIEFEDSENYHSQQSGGSNFKEIVLRQFQKCGTEGSKEMTVGGLMKRVIDGKVVELPVPNQIEIFINSVEVLKMILSTKLIENKGVVGERMKKFYDTQKLLSDDFGKNYSEVIHSINNCVVVSIRMKERIYTQQKSSLDRIQKYYEQAEIQNYRFLFETLSILLDHLKYFEEQGVTW